MRLAIPMILLFAKGLTAQTPISLKEAYEKMLAGGPVPTFDEILKVIDTIKPASAVEIHEELPVVLDAMEHKTDPQIAIWGTFAVTMISMRPDGTELLQPYADRLGTKLLTSTDSRVQNGILAAFVNMRGPAAEKKTRSYILRLMRESPSEELKANTVSLLLQATRNTPGRKDSSEVLDAIYVVFLQAKEVRTRTQILVALAVPGLTHPGLLKVVQDSLSDPDPNVKLTAIRATRQIGPVTDQARAQLAKLSGDLSQPEEIRQRATEALNNAPEVPNTWPPATPPPGFRKPSAPTTPK